MKPILILLFLILSLASVAQQTEELKVKQNSLSIISGYDQIKEDNLHGKVHRGILIGTIFQHSEIHKIISEYGAGLKVSILNTITEEFPSSYNIQIIGNYKYLYPIAGNKDLKYYMGPIADLRYGASAYFNWDESHLYWANYLSGGISNRLSYRLGSKTLDLNLDIPVVSAISRSNYNRQFKIDDLTFRGIVKSLCSNIEGALPNKHLFLNTSVEIKTFSSRHKLRSLGYAFKYHYMHASEGLPFQNIEHSLFYKFYF